MCFAVTEDCVRLGLRAGAVVFRGVHVAAAGPPLRSEIAWEVEAVRARFADPPPPPSENPSIPVATVTTLVSR